MVTDTEHPHVVSVLIRVIRGRILFGCGRKARCVLCGSLLIFLLTPLPVPSAEPVQKTHISFVITRLRIKDLLGFAHHFVFAVIALGVLFLTGCSGDTTDQRPNANAPAARSLRVTVFAAASLADVLDELKRDFARDAGGDKIDLSLANSAVLARQIEQGAPADLFFSASVEWADYLEQKSLVARRSDHVGNRLVLVVPQESPANVREINDLTNTAVSHIALADPKSAPAGKYAQKSLAALKLWERLEPKIVAADDVRQALLFVERGEADAGFVYATDAAASRRVRVVATVDEKLTGAIRYSLVLLKQGEQNSQAAAFYEYLCSPAAAKIFRRNGFQVHTGERAP